MGLDAGASPRPGMRGRDRGGKTGTPFLLFFQKERDKTKGILPLRMEEGYRRSLRTGLGEGLAAPRTEETWSEQGSQGSLSLGSWAMRRASSEAGAWAYVTSFLWGQLDRVGCQRVLRGQ